MPESVMLEVVMVLSAVSLGIAISALVIAGLTMSDVLRKALERKDK